ncbi:MAG: RluA family pseudouridine synthase, partial [Defluviitaleaceae bacterium]|nr:RluA family pseudouridine synthase [Defluviitaleaceae bacterium]
MNVPLSTADIGARLDVFLANELDDISRAMIQKLIVQNMILVNGAAEKAGYKLRPGDIINVSIPPPAALDVNAENIPLDVVYEDEHLIVINKPQGMVVHPAPGHCSGTLVNALLKHCKGGLSDINGVLRPGIVHRLDKDTSGLLLVAKNETA